MRYKRPTMMVDGKQVLCARYIMGKHLKRTLKECELVHHKDFNPFNNKLSNLQIVTRAEHKIIHDNIGINTRFKDIYKFDEKKLLDEYGRYLSSYKVSKIYKCHAITIERKIKEILGLKSLKNFLKTNRRNKNA